MACVALAVATTVSAPAGSRMASAAAGTRRSFELRLLSAITPTPGRRLVAKAPMRSGTCTPLPTGVDWPSLTCRALPTAWATAMSPDFTRCHSPSTDAVFSGV